MPQRRKIILSWSGGKDSALALHHLRSSGRYEIVSLLTTVAERYDRVSHHGVRVALLEQQAKAIGLPLDMIALPAQRCTNEVYEAVMERAMLRYRDAGVRTVAFGDIFLQDLREYRENNLAKIGMDAIFPLWGRDTIELMQTFIDGGFRACLSCVDGEKLGASFAGRSLDAGLLRDLPPDANPCGENGEYHSFVYDGPIFSRPVGVRVGEIVSRDTRYFADLLPEEGFSANPSPRTNEKPLVH